MVSRRYELTDEQWDKIKAYFDGKKGRPYNNVRNTVNGIVWILRSGAAWRDLPACYGSCNSVYKCFCKWQKTGLFEKIFSDLALECDFKKRHLVECFFQKLKRYRRIATRYDKLAKRFLAFIHLSCTLFGCFDLFNMP